MLEDYFQGLNFNDFYKLRDGVNRLVSDIMSGQYAKMNYPLVELLEEDDRYILNVEVSGAKKEDLKVTYHENEINIKGKRQKAELSQNAKSLRNELFYGDFSRDIKMPAEADGDNINAEYKDGILHLEILKKEEAKTQQINIDVK
ncbi:MAG: Hsp20/alpha crystallin family protein [Calditrichia bacterium]